MTRARQFTATGGGATEFISGATVANFAALPAAASNSGLYAGVLASTGTWILGTLKPKGLYYSDGATWEYLADYTQTDAASEITNDSGVAGTYVKDALNNLNATAYRKRIVGFSSLSPVTGQQGTFIQFPATGTITSWSIGVDAGTATVKVWKVAAGTAVPTISNVINTSGVAISSGTFIRSTTLTDFTSTAVTANDIFAFDLTAVSGVTKIVFELEITVT